MHVQLGCINHSMQTCDEKSCENMTHKHLPKVANGVRNDGESAVFARVWSKELVSWNFCVLIFPFRPLVFLLSPPNSSNLMFSPCNASRLPINSLFVFDYQL